MAERTNIGRSSAPGEWEIGRDIANQNLPTRQSEFAAAILNPDQPVPAGLVGPDGEPSARRFAVYRNNVVVGLCDALRESFPVVRRIVGDEFFAAMARIYVAHEPPDSPIMLEYGAGFADFIGSFEPVAELPYLMDVARIERAWVEAYCAPDAQSLGPDELATIAPDDIPSLFLTLHPSIRIVRSSFPALSIWRTNIEGVEPTPIDLDIGAEDALVFRPEAEVEVRLLPPGGATFIDALVRGLSIVDAMKEALANGSRFDLLGNLAELIATGAIVGYHLPPANTA